jgi:hypothetical protein
VATTEAGAGKRAADDARRSAAAAVDFRTLPYVTGDADAPIATDRSFVVESGRAGLHAA